MTDPLNKITERGVFCPTCGECALQRITKLVAKLVWDFDLCAACGFEGAHKRLADAWITNRRASQ